MVESVSQTEKDAAARTYVRTIRDVCFRALGEGNDLTRRGALIVSLGPSVA